MRDLYIIVGFIIILIPASCYCQIGIYTEYLLPESVLQVDPDKNSTTNGDNIADDMVLSVEDSTIMLGLGKKASSYAQLDLNSKNKALKINEVPLKSLTDTLTVLNPRAGMTVYNVTNDVYQDLSPGWYFYDGMKWNKILPSVQRISFRNEFSIPNIADSLTNIPAITLSDAKNNIYTSALKMPFENIDTKRIIAPDGGTYVFALRLYFFISKFNYPNPEDNYNYQEVLYLFLVSKTQNKVLNKTLITFPYNKKEAFNWFTSSYRVLMGTLLSKNEEVEFYIGRGKSPDYDDLKIKLRILDSTDPSLKSPARTSFFFWKL